MIIDDKGQMVWFKPMQGKLAADFRTQTYDGKPVLTWWEGRLFVGDGDGVGRIYDDTYKPIANVGTDRSDTGGGAGLLVPTTYCLPVERAHIRGPREDRAEVVHYVAQIPAKGNSGTLMTPTALNRPDYAIIPSTGILDSEVSRHIGR